MHVVIPILVGLALLLALSSSGPRTHVYLFFFYTSYLQYYYSRTWIIGPSCPFSRLCFVLTNLSFTVSSWVVNYPTTKGGMQKMEAQSELHARCTQVFARFGADLYTLSRCLLEKNFCVGAQSEVYEECRCWLGRCSGQDAFSELRSVIPTCPTFPLS